MWKLNFWSVEEKEGNGELGDAWRDQLLNRVWKRWRVPFSQIRLRIERQSSQVCEDLSNELVLRVHTEPGDAEGFLHLHWLLRGMWRDKKQDFVQGLARIAHISTIQCRELTFVGRLRIRPLRMGDCHELNPSLHRPLRPLRHLPSLSGRSHREPKDDW